MALIEFRDGEREIPDHLADLLSPYADRLYKITYEQAVEFANKATVTDLLNRKQDEIISQHFKRTRTG